MRHVARLQYSVEIVVLDTVLRSGVSERDILVLALYVILLTVTIVNCVCEAVGVCVLCVQMCVR